jgi:hypothetical protein
MRTTDVVISALRLPHAGAAAASSPIQWSADGDNAGLGPGSADPVALPVSQKVWWSRRLA